MGGLWPPLFYNKWQNTMNRIIDEIDRLIMQIHWNDCVMVIQYIAGILIIIGIVCAPAWIARQNGHGKPQMYAVRLGSWIFGWSIIAWLWSVFRATKK